MKDKKSYILILLCLIALCATIWVRDAYGKANLDQIFFHLQAPAEGMTSDISLIIIYECFIKAIILFLLIILFDLITRKLLKNNKVKLTFKNKTLTLFPLNLKSKYWFYFGIIILVYLAIDTLLYYEIPLYAKNTFTESSFIENHYVDPDNVSITFPENKKNLIYIYVESMESTYVSKEEGGTFENNLIPNLYNLAINNTSFMNKNYGGLYSVTDTNWTMAGLTAQTSGLPLKVSTKGSTYSDDYFLSDTTTLGDILKENGYNQMFMIGSDAVFGGRKTYFTIHGDYKIFDYEYALENNYVDYYKFWGFEDSKLISLAKEELLKLEEPFNFTMLTVDTHTPGGYLDEACENIYDEQIESVIACADKQLYDFVTWIQQQDFYQNTTIVIVGDHLNMDGSFIDNDADRKIYNVIINGPEVTKEIRQASSFDMFPTTLAALNVNIEGDKLGLGTNLYSNELTLIEKYGIDMVNDELKKKSIFYNDNFLKKDL